MRSRVIVAALLIAAGCADDPVPRERPTAVAVAGPACEGDELFRADVDRDGATDVVSSTAGAAPLLHWCPGDGPSSSTPGWPAEATALADLGGAPSLEILVGPTGMRGANLAVFSVAGGVIEPVVRSDGEQLVLVEGTAPEGAEDWWDCEMRDDALVVIQVAIVDGASTVTTRRLSGVRAETVPGTGSLATSDGPPGGSCPGLVRP